MPVHLLRARALLDTFAKPASFLHTALLRARISMLAQRNPRVRPKFKHVPERYTR